MENISQWVGIDISKATLDVYLRPLFYGNCLSFFELPLDNQDSHYKLLQNPKSKI
jgi:hypothetical protein